MTPFIRFLRENFERLRPLLQIRVVMKVALHRHPDIAGDAEAAERPCALSPRWNRSFCLEHGFQQEDRTELRSAGARFATMSCAIGTVQSTAVWDYQTGFYDVKELGDVTGLGRGLRKSERNFFVAVNRSAAATVCVFPTCCTWVTRPG